MEHLILTSESKKSICDYIPDNRLVRHEVCNINEIFKAIDKGNQIKLNEFQNFGNSLRAIVMNIHAYRKGLEFGFTEIAFDQYGWFKRPQWLDKEELKFGDCSRYGNYSTITLGHGPNNHWP